MKKFLLIAVAAFGMLMTACSKDEVAQPVAEKSTVTFTVAAPELATRADLGDGTTATQLSWAVYDKNHTLLFQSSEVTVMSDLKATVEIPFVNGMEYNILFWAEAVQSPYSVDWANLEVGYTNAAALVSNSEKYDAFYCYFTELDEVTGPVNENVELKRPFAQLNIKTNDHDNAVKSGLNVDQVSVEISEGCDKFNLANGEGIKAATGTKITFGNATKVANDHLAVNYLFTGGQKSLINVKFSYTDGDLTKGGDASGSMEFAAVPVQRNYRTNIVGSLLTSEGTFNVEIKEGFETEEHNVEVVTVASAQDLIDAFDALNDADDTNDPDQIILTGDIDLNDLFNSSSASASTRATTVDCLTLAKGRKLTLDLAGFDIVGVDKTAKNFGLIQNNGTLSIVNSGVEASNIKVSATTNSGWGRYSAVISNNPGGTLTVGHNIVIEHLGGTDMAYGIDNLTNSTIGDVKATIDGATVKSTYRAIRQFLNSDSKENQLTVKSGSVILGADNNYGVFFHDPSAKANNGTLIIEENARVQGVYLFVTAGSTAWPVDFSIAASSIVGEKGVVSANVPAGYAVAEQNGVWTKVEIDADAYVANIGAKGYETLQAAIEAVQEGETISLTKDLEFTEGINGNGISYTDNKSFTLDLKGKTVTSDLGGNALRFNIGNGNEVTNTEVTINIVNGKIVSGANNWSAISAATADNSNNKLIVNLDNLSIENYKAGDYAVKSWAGALVNATEVNVTSSYGGSFYAAGGEMILTDCTATQTGMHSAPYQSMAVAVSNEGKMTVESGSYTATPAKAEDGNNQGTSHGCFAAGVMNSGGELIINGGTFANGNFGDDASANAPRGLILADTGAVIEVTDGTFNALKGIIDYQNNLDDASKNPVVNITGGTFTADPYANQYVNAPAGYGAVMENGKWVVKQLDMASTEAELNALIGSLNNQTIYLSDNITLEAMIEIPAKKTITLDLNGKNITATGYAVYNTGTLTIKDSGATGVVKGTVYTEENAKTTIAGGTYNAAEGGAYVLLNSAGTLIIDNATINSGSSYPVYSYDPGAKLIINDATVNATLGCINTYGKNSTVEINGGTFNMTGVQGKTSHIAYFANSDVTINGGSFNKIGDISMSGVGGGGICATFGANLIVKNGSFAGAGAEKEGYIYNYGTNENNRETTISIQGGTYKTEPSFVATGYKAVENGDGTWSVVAE